MLSVLSKNDIYTNMVSLFLAGLEVGVAAEVVVVAEVALGQQDPQDLTTHCRLRPTT